MFNIGDTVLYGTTGVCKIDSTVFREIGGTKKEYFVLRPLAHDNATVFVPCDNPVLLDKMRRMLSRDEIESIINEVKASPDIWEEDDVARRELYGEIIRSGDRKRVMLLIRSLYNVRLARQAEGKRLHLSDERYLSEAERLLYDEFSAVLGLNPSEVDPYIIEQMEK